MGVPHAGPDEALAIPQRASFRFFEEGLLVLGVGSEKPTFAPLGRLWG
jgi:hypothetical protein